ncbi:MAG: Ribonuclease [Pseudomonadota bacterium]|jgi:ribonuclease PH
MTIQRHERQNNELRKIEIISYYTKYAEGSVLIKFGNTHVLCNASIIHKVPPHAKEKSEGWITAEYSMLPRATNSRTDRESSKGKQTGRTQEIQRLIGRSLRSAINLKDICGYAIHIDCDVIQADGGTRTASITGGWIALVHAIQYMYNNKLIANMPNIKQIAAVSIGILNQEVRLDLNYAEDSSCDTDLNLVMNSDGGIIEIQATAEGQTFSKNDLIQMQEIGEKGIYQLFKLQNSHI